MDASLCCTCWCEHRPDQHHRWVRYRLRHLKRLLHRKP
jgi:hypothetical protein